MFVDGAIGSCAEGKVDESAEDLPMVTFSRLG